MPNRNKARSSDYARDLLKAIRKLATTPIRIMEICGTHTMAIARSGMKQLLPETITLLSGPGCPVCVTDETEIDAACSLASMPKVILATYGDMIRVPGKSGTLASVRLAGADVRVIYSGQDALRLAVENPDRQIVLLGVGFETTIPTTAIAIETAVTEKIRNFSVLSLHKSVPPILKCLLADPELSIDAFLLPGHVCVISGTREFDFIAKTYARPGVAAGFEPVDILEAIVMLLAQTRRCRPAIEIQYSAVRPLGNAAARRYIDTYFQLVDSAWRGIGIVPGSGYAINDAYSEWDAAKKFNMPAQQPQKSNCLCGDILKGRKRPIECEFFGTACTPAAPQGPCMVSEEGSCAAVYRFERMGKGHE